MIAEDDSATRIILKSWLDDRLFDVTLAQDGREAWAVLERKDPRKLVILDWAMPEIDGIELCRKLRDTLRAYYPYVLMMAGRQEKREVCARSAGRGG